MRPKDRKELLRGHVSRKRCGLTRVDRLVAVEADRIDVHDANQGADDEDGAETKDREAPLRCDPVDVGDEGQRRGSGQPRHQDARSACGTVNPAPGMRAPPVVGAQSASMAIVCSFSLDPGRSVCGTTHDPPPRWVAAGT